MAQDLDIIDFHTHHVPRRWDLTTTIGLDDEQRQRWTKINEDLRSPEALLAAIEKGDVSARVINTPTALITPPGLPPRPDIYRKINDEVAGIAATSKGRLPGLASVDAFSGDAGALEATRAVKDLDLRGLFIESARGETLLDATEVRPTLEVAAALDVPIFVHPINPQPWTRQMAPYGRLGTMFARGSINEAALVSLIAGGVFKAMPNLKVVVTNLAIGGLLLAGGFAEEQGGEVAAILRRNVFIDTMGFHPVLLRAAIDLVGVENVLAGSDWPIAGNRPIRPRLQAAVAAAGLTDTEAALVAAGNARRILKLN